MSVRAHAFLEVEHGRAPLVISLPHTGTLIPPQIEARLASPWLARKDTDWWIDRLYDFAAALGASVVRTRISRTVIDVNRDPSGTSLYPGQATTELCPTTTFDGEPLYRAGEEPSDLEVAERRDSYFRWYHHSLNAAIARLRTEHEHVVVYDCHSIRSVIPRLFEGTLPHLSIGTNGGASCDPALAAAIERACAGSGFSHVTNGRFKGGWITRRYGDPQAGVHAVQMELACRGYMPEPLGPVTEEQWPAAFDEACAAPMRATLARILEACLRFAAARSPARNLR